MSYRPKLHINAGENSLLFLNPRGADFAIVFIHGFGGAAAGTWAGFESIASELERWDMIFYGYPSLAGQANAHAEFFRIFLGSLLHQPHKIYSELDGRNYKHVLVVAHSLGSIVTRRALLNSVLVDHKKPVIDKVSMVLFAPAHLGATDIEKVYGKVLDSTPELFLGEVAGGIAGALANVSVAKSLRDMRQGSITLDKLQLETEKYLEAWKQDSPAYHLIARRVVFGSGEDIVDANRFCQDPVSEFIDLSAAEGLGGVKSRWIPGADHLAICKPQHNLEYPKEVIRAERQTIEGCFSQEKHFDLLPPSVALPTDDEAIASELVPDSEKVLQICLDWLAHHKTDGPALAKCLRDHRLSPITDPTENAVRAGLDILLDRVSVLEIAVLSGYHRELRKPESELRDILELARVKDYYTHIYPSPLVEQYLLRVAQDLPMPSTTPGAGAFLRFALLQSAFSEKTVRQFRLLLDDYRVFDSNLPQGYLTWTGLVQLIQSPALYRRALSAEETGGTLAVAGYRDFLEFLQNLEQFCLIWSEFPEFVQAVKLFYSYWLYQFGTKFRPLIEVTRSDGPAPRSAVDVNRLKFCSLLDRLIDPEVKREMWELDLQARQKHHPEDQSPRPA